MKTVLVVGFIVGLVVSYIGRDWNTVLDSWQFEWFEWKMFGGGRRFF